jgi:poly(A) polymerase
MHPKFRAAYDFLLLRAQSGERLENLVDYWTKEQLDEPLAGKDKPRKLGNRSNSSYRRTRNSRKKDL